MIKISKNTDLRYTIYSDTTNIAYFKINIDTSVVEVYNYSDLLIEECGNRKAYDDYTNYRGFWLYDTIKDTCTKRFKWYRLKPANTLCVLSEDTLNYVIIEDVSVKSLKFKKAQYFPEHDMNNHLIKFKKVYVFS